MKDNVNYQEPIVKKGFFGRLLCGHMWSHNLKKNFIINDDKVVGKRHYKYCCKCGKRKFVD